MLHARKCFSRFCITAALFALVCAQTACAAGVAAVPQRPSPVISLDIPAQVHDGQAFAVSLTASAAADGTNIRTVTFQFLDRNVTAAATPVKNRPSVVAATALLPVPLGHKDGLYPVSWNAACSDGVRTGSSGTIRVVRKEYPAQQLTLEQKYVTPDPTLKDRIARESKQLGAALGTMSPDRFWVLPLARPVPGSLSSVFGLRRVLNGQPRGAHKGLDFRGATGTPITVLAPGKVVLAGDFYYPGKFVVIDHGQGVVSISMHMSKIDAAAGQRVKNGDVIGRIGATGRVTGPHLHLGLSVLGQSVDPLPLLEKGADTWEPKDPVKENP